MHAESTESPTAASTEVKPPKEWLNAGRFAALLALLVFATYAAVLIGQATFAVRDFGLFSYPVAFFQRESFWRGELPLWNPWSLCGVPFLAQWNTMVLYPPSLLYLLFPLTWSLPFFCLAHLFWGGLGMYFLARRWTNAGLAAGVAGVLFSFSGLMTNFLMWPSHIATFSWLPWVVWLTEAAWLRGGRKLVVAVLAGAMQMLAGGPETILLTWILLALLAAGDWWRCRESRVLIPLRFLAMVCLVALVCAAQLLPFLQLVFHSQRDSGFGGSDWAMPAWGWANLLVPLFHARQGAGEVFYQHDQYWTTSYYVGVGTVLLAMVALRQWRVRPVLLLTGLAGCGLVLALGDAGWLYGVLRRSIPGLGFMRYPVKFVILVTALAPLLAAFGVQALARQRQWRSRFAWGCTLALLGFIGLIVGADWASAKAGVYHASLWNGLSRAGLLLATLLLLQAYLKAAAGRQVLFGCLVLVAFWLDLATHMPTQNPTVSPSVYAPGWAKAQRNWNPQPELGHSRAMIAPAVQAYLKHHSLNDITQNYLLQRAALEDNCNLLEEVPQVHGFFSLAPMESGDATTLPYVITNRDFNALLDFMGVVQISSPADPLEWRPRSTAMPLLTAGQQPIFTNDQSILTAFCQGQCDLRQVVFLPPEARNSVSAGRQPGARVLSAAFGQQSVTCQVKADAAALVVVSQSFYPGWKAEVDGQPARLWRANFAFQALQVPAGEHSIRLVYRDNTFRLGALCSAAGLLLCLALWFRGQTVRPG